MTDTTSGTSSITGIIVAAGRSTRMAGRQSKLLLPWAGGRTIVEATVDTLLASAVDEVIVVIGHDSELVVSKLESRPIRLVDNEDFADGLSTSIRCGVGAAGATQAYLIALADMPCIKTATINILCNKIAEVGSGGIAVPIMDGGRGHPVAFGSDHREGLLALSGDKGARGLIEANAKEVYEVAVNDSGIFADVDTPQAYAEAFAGLGQ
jgi:molybdenum cofactor cytidylyltransferase